MEVERKRRSASRGKSPPRDCPPLTEREEETPNDSEEVAQRLAKTLDSQRENVLQRITRKAEAAEPSKGEKTPYEVEWIGGVRGLKIIVECRKALGILVEQHGGRVRFPVEAGIVHKYSGEEGLGLKQRSVLRMEDEKMRKPLGSLSQLQEDGPSVDWEHGFRQFESYGVAKSLPLGR